MEPILLHEGFEGPGYENEGWNELVDEGCSVIPDFELDTLPQIKGDYVLKSYSANNINEWAAAYYSLDVAHQARNDISAWIKLANHSLTNSKAIYALELCVTNGARIAVVEYYFINNKLHLLFKCLSNGQWIYGTEWIPVEEGEWFLVNFVYDLENFKYKFRLNNKTYGKGDLGFTSYPTNVKRLHVGISNNTSEGDATLYVANVEWDG